MRSVSHAIHRKKRRRATGRFAIFLIIIVLCSISVFFLLQAFPISRLKPSLTAESESFPVAAFQEASTYTVILDAGHGGDDFGTVGTSTGQKEKEVNLEIAVRLKDLLEQSGIHVIMTRVSDDMIAPTKEEDMQKRETIIRDSHADLFLSIHQNFYDSSSEIYGPQVFYREAGAKGERLAEIIQNEMNRQLKIKDPRTANTGDYQLLRPGDQPSVIVECGFFSNPQEERLLQDPEYQQKIAYAIASGIMEYKEQRSSTVL